MPGPDLIRRWRERRRPEARAGDLFNISWLATHPRDANERHIRALATAIALPNDEALCRVLGRYKMIVPATDIDIAPHLMIDGYWEMWLTEQIAARVRPGMTVGDVGANSGYFTLLMADLAGPPGRVLACEPNPRMVDLLRRNARANGWQDRVTIIDAPLSDVSGRQVCLAFDHAEPGGAVIFDADPGHLDTVIPLTTATLDALPGAHDLALLKIDIEGSEERVWAGMRGVLQGNALKTVFLEWCAIRYADPERFLHDLTAPGFRLHRLDLAEGLVPVRPGAILGRDPHDDVTLALLRD